MMNTWADAGTRYAPQKSKQDYYTCSSWKEIRLLESEPEVQEMEAEDKLIFEKCFIYVYGDVCVSFCFEMSNASVCPVNLALEKAAGLNRRREVVIALSSLQSESLSSRAYEDCLLLGGNGSSFFPWL